MKADAQDIQARVAAFVEMCRRQGIKATHQRMEIYRELVSTHEHPDAESVYKRVRKRVAAISLDTVYRTLRLLREKGIISSVTALPERMRFDANTSQHHHFICTRCGLVRDFYDRRLDGLPVPREVSDMGMVRSIHVELRGLCRRCETK
jgi:Fur family peroxide stress response transcriptional regulator